MIQPDVVFKNISIAESSTTWLVPMDLPYFEGHFPGFPVLPAVAMVDASTYILRQSLGRQELVLKAVLHAKFLSPIGPGANLRIDVNQVGDDRWRLEWKERDSDRLMSTLEVQV